MAAEAEKSTWKVTIYFPNVAAEATQLGRIG